MLNLCIYRGHIHTNLIHTEFNNFILIITHNQKIAFHSEAKNSPLKTAPSSFLNFPLFCLLSQIHFVSVNFIRSLEFTVYYIFSIRSVMSVNMQFYLF